jgi:hypothetical protein
MMRSRQRRDDSRHASDESDEELSDEKSPPHRGRTGKEEDAVDAQLARMIAEGSKQSGQ